MNNTMTKSQSVPAVTMERHDPGKIHPWEFGYERKRHGNPYWEHATRIPKDFGTAKAMASLSNFPLPHTEKDGTLYSSQDKEILLAKYDPSILEVCARCYKSFVPIWRPLRNNFKKSQVPTQKGNILATHFISVLESHGVSLSKKDLGLIVKNFRGVGMEDLVKYDDFLRICMLMKDNH
jgi:hypothetical protein